MAHSHWRHHQKVAILPRSNNNNLSNKFYLGSYSFFILGSHRRYYRPLLTAPSGRQPLRVCAEIHVLLPYVIRWVAEGVVTALKKGARSEADGRSLELKYFESGLFHHISVRCGPPWSNYPRTFLCLYSILNASVLPPSCNRLPSGESASASLFRPSLSTTSGGEWKVPQKVERL